MTMADYNTPDSYKRRREMAQLMLLQGSSSAPVQHWSQGANRIAQALFGGMNMNAVNQEEKAAREQATQDALSGFKSGNMSSIVSALGNPMTPPAISTVGASVVSNAFNPKEAPDALRVVDAIRANPTAYGFTGTNDPALQAAIRNRLGGPGTNVTINQGAETSFSKEGGKLQAERFDSYVKAGDDARNVIADLDSLREIGSRITTGKTAEITAALGPYAEMVGVKIDGLDDLQAYKSIVAKMAPRMRPPGSGATSDFDLRQYIEALPGLGKTPEGNEIITNTNKSLMEHRMKVSEIASRAINGEIPRVEAEKLIRELPDPLELWKKNRGKTPAAKSDKAGPLKPGTYNWSPSGVTPAQ